MGLFSLKDIKKFLIRKFKHKDAPVRVLDIMSQIIMLVVAGSFFCVIENMVFFCFINILPSEIGLGIQDLITFENVLFYSMATFVVIILVELFGVYIWIAMPVVALGVIIYKLLLCIPIGRDLLPSDNIPKAIAFDILYSSLFLYLIRQFQSLQNRKFDRQFFAIGILVASLAFAYAWVQSDNFKTKNYPSNPIIIRLKENRELVEADSIRAFSSGLLIAKDGRLNFIKIDEVVAIGFARK